MNNRHPLDDELVRFCFAIALLPYVLALSLGALAYDIGKGIADAVSKRVEKYLNGGDVQ